MKAEVTFPAGSAEAAERDAAWAAAGPEVVLAYAEMHEAENDLDFEFDEFDWVYVPRLPLADLGGKRFWKRWWKEQRLEAEENGSPERWDSLLDEPVMEPVTIAFGGRVASRHSFQIWDGNHRTGASVITGRLDVPAVVGVPRGVVIDDLPPSVREAVKAAMAARQPVPEAAGTAP